MKRIAFVGQAMPKVKRHPHDWPSLNKWLYTINIQDTHIATNFFYSALVDYFPGTKNGSHKVPTPGEIAAERDRLRQALVKFAPDILVPIGKLSIGYCLNNLSLELGEVVGKTFQVNPYNLYSKKILVIPLPHPSGASVWYRTPANSKKLLQALECLKTAYAD